jgi:hypothetical protein
VSPLNPYEKYLDGRPLEAIVASTAGAIAGSLQLIGPRQDERPQPGKWSAKEIVCHLADCEMSFGIRLRQALAEDGLVVQRVDETRWAGNYAGITAAYGLETFSVFRNWNLLLIRTALPTAPKTTLIYPGRGPLTFETIVATMAGHDLNHLQQLQRIAGRP